MIDQLVNRALGVMFIYMREEQIIGPVKMAKKFNFRIRHLMFTGFDQLNI